MLDEPNEDMYSSIREKITDYGKEAIPLLEEAWLKAGSDGDVRRIEDLIDNIRFDDIYTELHNWAQFHNNDLVKAFILLSKFRYPELEEERYLGQIEKIKQDIWLEINPNLTALEKVKVLNHVFYDVYQLRGQLPQQVKLNSYFLNEVLDSKKGSAIALVILYISIAQSLGIPVFGLDLYHHFGAVYMDDTIETKAPEEYTDDEVLFYIAVVNKGSVFTRNEIDRYLKQSKMDAKPEYYMPVVNIHIIKRLIEEMMSVLNKENKKDEAERLSRLIPLLKPGN